MLDTEPERLLPLLTIESARSLPFIAELLDAVPRARGASRPLAGGRRHRAGGRLPRAGILSLIGSPGRWDLEDDEQVRELVRDELLGGIER